MKLESLFSEKKPIIGMVHLLPLPGSPGFAGSLEDIYTRAEWEIDILYKAGVDGMIIENLGDEPYLIGEPSAEQLAIMAAVTYQARRSTAMPVGVNVQFNAWQAEIGLAYGCMADFVRVEVFVDTVLMAQGSVQPCAAQITRYRKALNAQGVHLFADIQTKYTRNVLAQSLGVSARDAEAAGADALIVTGAGTGMATPLEAVTEARQASALPLLVGSGTHSGNVAEVLQHADGVIIGSALKEDGRAENKVSLERATAFMQQVKTIRAEMG